jgi:hypothetical protein
MISDVINAGEIKPMIDYVKRYCDVIDGPEDAQRIADDIVSGDGTDDADSQYSPGWHGTEVTSRGRVDYIDARSAYPNVAACETHLVIDCDAEECQPEHTKTGDSQ